MLHKCITASIRAIWQHAAYTTDQLAAPSCYTGAIHKAYLLTKTIKNFLEKVRKKKMRQKEY